MERNVIFRKNTIIVFALVVMTDEAMSKGNVV